MTKKDMTIYELTVKILGRIEPVGETNEDKDRFSNLMETCNLIEYLVDDVIGVAANKERHEYSMRKAGVYADQFITQLKEKLKP